MPMESGVTAIAPAVSVLGSNTDLFNGNGTLSFSAEDEKSVAIASLIADYNALNYLEVVSVQNIAFQSGIETIAVPFISCDVGGTAFEIILPFNISIESEPTQFRVTLSSMFSEPVRYLSTGPYTWSIIFKTLNAAAITRSVVYSYSAEFGIAQT